MLLAAEGAGLTFPKPAHTPGKHTHLLPSTHAQCVSCSTTRASISLQSLPRTVAPSVSAQCSQHAGPGPQREGSLRVSAAGRLQEEVEGGAR